MQQLNQQLTSQPNGHTFNVLYEKTEQSILLTITPEFDYDDIEQIAAICWQAISGAEVVEEIPGADRINYRFRYNQHYFVLNFEVYSQSCWIEVEAGSAHPALEVLLAGFSR